VRIVESFSVARIDGQSDFVVVEDQTNSPIRTSGGKFLVTSDNSELLEFIVDDLHRCGTVKIKDDGSLDFNQVPCAYAVYSFQRELVESQSEKFESSVQTAPAHDRLLVQIANGPPLEVSQIEGLAKARLALSDLIGEDRVGLLTEYAWGKLYSTQYAAFNTEVVNAENYDGPGRFISDEDFRDSEVSKHIVSIISLLNIHQKSAFLATWLFATRESGLLALLLITERLSPTSFARSCLYLGENILNFAEDELENPEEAKREQFEAVLAIANLALTYGGFGENEILAEVRQGENDLREFKSSFFLDINKQTKEDAISLQIIKTIAAFLNSKGGTLYVGVSDDCQIVGVDSEISLFFKGSLDKYKLAVKEKIKTHFNGFYDLIEWQGREVLNKTVLKVSVAKAGRPVFVTDKGKEHFFVRTNPATEALEGSRLVDYLGRRFKA
jgi:hypothetical protein